MPIPQHKIKRGSIVSLANHGEYIYNIHDRRQAVVTKVEKERIEVAFYEDLQLIPTALMSKCQMYVSIINKQVIISAYIFFWFSI